MISYLRGHYLLVVWNNVDVPNESIPPIFILFYSFEYVWRTSWVRDLCWNPAQSGMTMNWTQYLRILTQDTSLYGQSWQSESWSWPEPASLYQRPDRRPLFMYYPAWGEVHSVMPLILSYPFWHVVCVWTAVMIIEYYNCEDDWGSIQKHNSGEIHSYKTKHHVSVCSITIITRGFIALAVSRRTQLEWKLSC